MSGISNRSRFEEYHNSKEDKDFEQSYHSSDRNNPTTTYIDAATGLESSLSFKSKKRRLHNRTRYLRFGWTRGPARVSAHQKYRLFNRRLGQSLLEGTQNNNPSSAAENQLMNITEYTPKMLKKKKSRSRDLSSLTESVTKRKTTSKENKRLPHKITPQTCELLSMVDEDEICLES